MSILSKLFEVAKENIYLYQKSTEGDMYLWWVENIQLLLGYHTLVHRIASGLLDIRLIRKEK